MRGRWNDHNDLHQPPPGKEKETAQDKNYSKCWQDCESLTHATATPTCMNDN